MKIKRLLAFALAGIFAGILSAIIYNEKASTQPPIAVSYNPYDTGIYATGIVESDQVNGSNVNIYPEVSGKVTQIFVRNGQVIKKNSPILTIDDSTQRAIVEKDKAQVKYAETYLINLQKQLEKTKKSYRLNAKSISLNALDNAIYAVQLADDSLKVAKAQYQSDLTILDQYTVRSSINGTILRVVSTVGDYVSPQGSYDFYTQSYLPTIQMGVVSPDLHVRSYVDEILIPRLPDTKKLQAKMFIRGLNNVSVPLEFVSIQPLTIPNIELSNQRTERVDVRVLPIVFKFKKPPDMPIFPGQLVDIYIRGKA